jgi:Fe-S oxidoreductase
MLTMNMSAPSLPEFLTVAGQAFNDACTRCGKCVEVCPVTPSADIDPAEGPKIMDGLLGQLLHGSALEDDAERWSQQCNGCGVCIPACPEGLNPRRLLMLAATRGARQGGKTPQLFRKMARAIRIMAAMQLAPEELHRLLVPPRAHDAEVIFYLGCNPVRTPHLLFNAMVILDTLETDYEVVGGPAACCGIIHAKWEGAFEAGEKVTDGTLTRFADYRPEKVLSWCPSCVLHLGETLQGFRSTSFDFDHITKYLGERSQDLQAAFNTPIERRVLLHAHEGMDEIGATVARLLAAIPGLTLVDTAMEPGYTCGGSGADRSPKLKARARMATLERAAADDVDTLVSLFHGCHGQLAGEEKHGAFEVMNWTDLLVQALGASPHRDLSKRYRMQDDWDAVIEEGEVYLLSNGIELDRDWFRTVLPEIFAQAEFKGGLEAFAAPSSR